MDDWEPEAVSSFSLDLFVRFAARNRWSNKSFFARWYHSQMELVQLHLHWLRFSSWACRCTAAPTVRWSWRRDDISMALLPSGGIPVAHTSSEIEWRTWSCIFVAQGCKRRICLDELNCGLSRQEEDHRIPLFSTVDRSHTYLGILGFWWRVR